jgi:hypothetical protein
MDMKRLNGPDRSMIEMRLRRGAGSRAVVAMAVVGFVASVVIDVGTDGGSEVGAQTDSYERRAPARLEDLYRRESIATAPATRAYESPELAGARARHG